MKNEILSPEIVRRDTNKKEIKKAKNFFMPRKQSFENTRNFQNEKNKIREL